MFAPMISIPLVVEIIIMIYPALFLLPVLYTPKRDIATKSGLLEFSRDI